MIRALLFAFLWCLTNSIGSAQEASEAKIDASQTTQIRFTGPEGMEIGWQVGKAFAENQLQAPARYNFPQGGTYRLQLRNIAGHEGLTVYPTLQIVLQTTGEEVSQYLDHNAVPVTFTDEDFDQVEANNMVTKVFYLPNPASQKNAVPSIEILNSTKAAPGSDLRVEAAKLGSAIAVIRLTNRSPQAGDPPLKSEPGKVIPPQDIAEGQPLVASKLTEPKPAIILIIAPNARQSEVISQVVEALEKAGIAKAESPDKVAPSTSAIHVSLSLRADESYEKIKHLVEALQAAGVEQLSFQAGGVQEVQNAIRLTAQPHSTTDELHRVELAITASAKQSGLQFLLQTQTLGQENAPANDPSDPQQLLQKELAKFVGKWQEASRKTFILEFKLQGDQLHYIENDEGRYETGTIQLDLGPTPRRMEMNPGGNSAKPLLGLYAWDGVDAATERPPRMRLALDTGEYPKSLEGKVAGLMVFERVGDVVTSSQLRNSPATVNPPAGQSGHSFGAGRSPLGSGGGGTSAKPQSVSPDPDASSRERNQQLAVAVAEAIRRAKFGAKDIQIEVRDGVCALTGRWRNPDDHTRAEKLALEIPGIKSVQHEPLARKSLEAAPAASMVKVFSLQHARAIEAAEVLRLVYDNGPSKIVPDARTNSVIITGPVAQLEEIEALLLKLDEGGPANPNARRVPVDPTQSEAAKLVVQLEDELAQLQQSVGANHPKVKELQARIAAARQNVRPDTASSLPGTPVTNVNPLGEITHLDAEGERLRQRLEADKKNLERSQALMKEGVISAQKAQEAEAVVRVTEADLAAHEAQRSAVLQLFKAQLFKALDDALENIQSSGQIEKAELQNAEKQIEAIITQVDNSPQQALTAANDLISQLDSELVKRLEKAIETTRTDDSRINTWQTALRQAQRRARTRKLLPGSLPATETMFGKYDRDFQAQTEAGSRLPAVSLGNGNGTGSTSGEVQQQIVQLRKEYEAADAQAHLLARNLLQTPDEAKKADLRRAVQRAFTARQSLLRAELLEMHGKLLQSQRSIEMRERISDQIIQRRVEDLLNPQLEWESPAQLSGDETETEDPQTKTRRIGAYSTDKFDSKVLSHTPYKNGILLKRVLEGPAQRAGLMDGDILVSLNGLATATNEDFHRILQTTPGSLQFEVVRNGQVVRGELIPDEAHQKGNTRVLVALKDIRPGERLVEGENVAFKEYPQSALVIYYKGDLIESLDEFSERVSVKGPYASGDIIRKTRLTERGPIPKGMRIFKFSANNIQTRAGLLRPGDSVDVTVTFSDRKGIIVTKLLLERIEVYATENKTAGSAESQSDQRSHNVLLLVTPEQDGFAKIAQMKGQLALSLRHPDDVEVKYSSGINAAIMEELQRSIGSDDFGHKTELAHDPQAAILAKLQGTWEVEWQSENLTKAEKPKFRVFTEIRDNVMTLFVDPPQPDNDKPPVFLLKMGEPGKPQPIDLVMNPNDGEKRYEMPGIIEIQDDIVRICYDPNSDAKRPELFAVGSHADIYILRRPAKQETKQPTTADILTQLQGTWDAELQSASSGTDGGDQLRGVRAEVTIEGNLLKLWEIVPPQPGLTDETLRTEAGAMVLTLGAAGPPQQVDLVIGPNDGDKRRETLGVIEITGETVKLCYDPHDVKGDVQRPTAFAVGKHADLWTLKRRQVAAKVTELEGDWHLESATDGTGKPREIQPDNWTIRGRQLVFDFSTGSRDVCQIDVDSQAKTIRWHKDGQEVFSPADYVLQGDQLTLHERPNMVKVLRRGHVQLAASAPIPRSAEAIAERLKALQGTWAVDYYDAPKKDKIGELQEIRINGDQLSMHGLRPEGEGNLPKVETMKIDLTDSSDERAVNLVGELPGRGTVKVFALYEITKDTLALTFLKDSPRPKEFGETGATCIRAKRKPVSTEPVPPPSPDPSATSQR